MTVEADLGICETTLERAALLVERGLVHTAGAPDERHVEVLTYELVHAAASVRSARAMLSWGRHGETEAALACAHTAEAIHDVACRVIGHEQDLGVDEGSAEALVRNVSGFRATGFLSGLATARLARHLDADWDLVRTTFRRFAEERVKPHAQEVHREDLDVPDEVIEGLAQLGAFGLSIPTEFGGGASGGAGDQMAMVIATEELSRASLGIGGSLITRPEAVARALLTGGTEEQKNRWLPDIASGRILSAVAVTEPDHGSDVGGVTFSATPDGSSGWVLDGAKMWCTFAGRADVLLVLARTDPDRSLRHKGLSLFMVEKERCDGHGFFFEQHGGGSLEGRAISTLGYRGMHSFELSFRGWRVPGDALLGGPEGVGRGFYQTMEAFGTARIQTAARATGLMQAAFDDSVDYARDRIVFGQPLIDYELTRVRLARMAVAIEAARQLTYEIAGAAGGSDAALDAAMAKVYACRVAETVTRDAAQLHGGIGYAEETPVSRYFVDARVLPVFEGTDETLCLRVIGPRLRQAIERDEGPLRSATESTAAE